MSKLKSLTNKFKAKRVKNNSNDQQEESVLVRRMSASSDGAKSDSSDNNRDDLLETYRSVSEIPKKNPKFKFWNFFDWPFKNSAYNRMNPENKKWLIAYKYMSYIAMILMLIAYIFFILLLCSPLIHVEYGEIRDDEIFVPVTESLLHSVVALWNQGAYIVVFVVFVFSITLPFIKLIATTLSYYITARHRRKQIELFFGSKIKQSSHTKFLSGEAADFNNEYNVDESQESLEYAKYEDGRLIKYAREVLLILKLISKFQMVDLLILMLNVAFLRSAFAWARPGMGMLHLFIYCVASILGTQLLNLAVEGEREMFDYWKAVRLICLPNLDSYYSNNYHSVQENVEVLRLGMKSLSLETGNLFLKTGINTNHSGAYDVNKEVEMEMNSGLSIMSKSIAAGTNPPSVFNIMNKTSGIDVLSNCTSEVDYYDLLFMDKKKEIKMRWYRSNVFISILVVINLISAGMIMSKEKVFGITFTADYERVFGADGTQMSFFQIILNIRDCWNYLPFFVFFFLSIFIPVVFHLMFLTGLFLYNFSVSNKGFNSLSKFDPGKPMVHPCKCLYLPVKATKFIFKFCNFLSEWSLGDVMALGFLAGFVSLWTAPNVRFYIPPKKICSVFIVMGSFGVSSFLLNIQFFMWYTRIINRLSDVTIYIESVHSMTSSTNSDLNSNANFESNNTLKTLHDNGSNDLKMVIKESKDNLQRLESYIEGGRNVDVYEPGNYEEHEKRKRRRSTKKMVFKIIDFIRHFIYSKFVVSIFFALMFVLTMYFFIYSFAFKFKPTVVDENKVQSLLDNGLPKIFNLVAKNAPRSYGDCNYKVIPPQPCVGNGSIYQYRTGLMFDLVWITGLNTIQLVDARFLVTEDKRLQFRIHVKFSGLRPYIKAGFCTYRCNTLVAGDKMCCGDDVHAVGVVSVSCNDTFPHFRDIRVDEMKIKNLKFKNEIDFILDQLVKIQDILEKQLTRLVNDFLEKQDSVLVWRGVPMSLLDFVNFLLKINFPAGIKCSV